jgi:hypothetical protein
MSIQSLPPLLYRISNRTGRRNSWTDTYVVNIDTRDSVRLFPRENDIFPPRPLTRKYITSQFFFVNRLFKDCYAPVCNLLFEPYSVLCLFSPKYVGNISSKRVMHHWISRNIRSISRSLKLQPSLQIMLLKSRLLSPKSHLNFPLDSIVIFYDNGWRWLFIPYKCHPLHLAQLVSAFISVKCLEVPRYYQPR